MKKLLPLFAVLLMLSSVFAQNVSPDYSPEGYVDKGLSSLGIDGDSSFIFGGGNFISGLSDPVISWMAQVLEPFGLGQYSFIFFYTLTILFIGMIIPMAVFAIILSYLAYLVGAHYNLEFTFILMLLGLFIGAIVGWRVGHGSDKFKRLRKVFLVLFVLVFLVMIGFIILKTLGFTLI